MGGAEGGGEPRVDSLPNNIESQCLCVFIRQLHCVADVSEFVPDSGLLIAGL